MLHITFKRAKEAGACATSYKKMAQSLGGVNKYGEDTPIPLDKVLEVCGLSDTLWALQNTIEPVEREKRLLACDYAERVLPLFERVFPKDNRPRQAIEVSRRFANGEATKKELRAARAAAWAARDAAGDAWDAAWAARAAGDAWDAARAAAWAAGDAWDAARAAAWAARDAAWAARAARDAAWAARDAERKWQEQKLLEMLNSINH